ncbi:MAG: hypothetical protein ACYDCC_11135 [Actinomycetota bacterium]
MNRAGIIAIVALLALMGAACSKKAGNVGGAKTVAPSDISSQDLSTAKFKTGTAHVEVTGQLHQTLDMTIKANSTQWSPQGMSLFFRDAGGDLLGLGGSSSIGKRATSSLMSFTFTDANPSLLGISFKGECIVNVTRSDDSGVDASVVCTNWNIENKRVVDLKVMLSVRA